MSAFGEAIDRLYDTVVSRKTADAGESYTAKLLSKGPAKIAKKVGEEAVEVAIAGAQRDAPALREESADLLYHLNVLWAACDVTPREVAEILRAREGLSGLAEKAARNED